MIRRPPRSTLFPYRRSSDLCRPPRSPRPAIHPGPSAGTRSEEHTSELQSQSNLVCRLLLEKKKTRKQLLRTTRAAPAPASDPRQPQACPSVLECAHSVVIGLCLFSSLNLFFFFLNNRPPPKFPLFPHPPPFRS